LIYIVDIYLESDGFTPKDISTLNDACVYFVVQFEALFVRGDPGVLDRTM